MAKTILPLSVSPKTADIALNGEALELNPFANAGITADDAPVLLALGSKATVGADALAGRMAKSGGHGTKAEARLFLNTFAEVMGDLVDEYGAITVQTPFGTMQTFITGTIANPQDQPDPSVNYAFLGVVIPEAYRRLFAQIETYVPSEACPAALKRVRDKATNASGIRGTDPFYLEGREMTHGGDGETLEFLHGTTREKLCDISVDAESKSTVQFLCTLAPQTALEAGTYLVRLRTLAGGEGPLWPLELKTELLEPVPEPETTITGVTDADGKPQLSCEKGFTIAGGNLPAEFGADDEIVSQDPESGEVHGRMAFTEIADAGCIGSRTATAITVKPEFWTLPICSFAPGDLAVFRIGAATHEELVVIDG